MKIFIDCSNLQVGGGIQVALSFLYDLNGMELSEKFFVLLSPHITESVDKKMFKSNFDFQELPKKFYNNFLKRGKAIQKIEKEIKPDVIFTVFGPSYHKSDVPKIVGYAIPHYIYKDSPFFDLLSFKETIRLFLMRKFQIKLFKHADKLVFETKDAQLRFCANYFYNVENTFTVTNRLNQIFLRPNLWKNRKFIFNTSNAILCLSANYKHKNLAIIPGVIEFLKKEGFRDFKFIISLKKEELNFDKKYDEHVEYLGKVPIEVLPSLFKSVNLLFLPTLLECFSTTYLEAMFMKIPIVTTDLSFARDVCGNAAMYYNPLDTRAAAEKIKNVLSDQQIRSNLIANGNDNLKRFGTSTERTQEYLRIIRETIAQ